LLTHARDVQIGYRRSSSSSTTNGCCVPFFSFFSSLEPESTHTQPDSTLMSALSSMALEDVFLQTYARRQEICQLPLQLVLRVDFFFFFFSFFFFFFVLFGCPRTLVFCRSRRFFFGYYMTAEIMNTRRPSKVNTEQTMSGIWRAQLHPFL
jgi:hypothetical protein